VPARRRSRVGGRDRRADGLAEHHAETGEPTVSLSTTPFELMRLLGSRRSRRQVLGAPWEGDIGPFVNALAHMPLPTSDVVE